MTIHSETVTFDWKPDYPLVSVAKRYWEPTSSHSRQEGFTLIFTHGISCNKEQWEPSLRHLFNLAKHSNSGPLIREAWIIECPNHGASAILNEELLLRGGYDLVFSWDEYIKVIYLFLTQNRKTDFSNHNLIGIGHSMGAVCLALTLSYPCPPRFNSLIFCEPMFGPTDIPRDNPVLKGPEEVYKLALKRKDTWPNRQVALLQFKTRRTFQDWDEEVLVAYATYGLRELPTATYPEINEGVTLACTKIQEAATYRDSVTSRRGYEFLPTLFSLLPVHLIWGEHDDLLAREVKNRITHPKGGKNPTSTRHVNGAGHLFVQTVPKRVAEAIYQAMATGSGQLQMHTVSGRL